MTPRVFGIDYQFLACGDVFTQGLVHAAADLGIPYAHADWRTPNLDAQVAAFKPDLLFVVHGRQFSKRWHNAFAHLRTAVWLLDEPYEVDDTARFSRAFSHVFICDPTTLHRHERASYLPVCYDPHLHSPGAVERTFKVGFVGGGNRTRDRYLAALARAGCLGYVIGGTWSSPEVTRLCAARNIAPRDTAARYRATQIVLNVFRETHHYNDAKVPATSLNPRVYEAFACGALVVSEWRPEAESLLPEMPTFHSESECVRLITDLLTQPARAEAIRQACAARIAPHTYAARLQTVLQVCGLAAPEPVEARA